MICITTTPKLEKKSDMSSNVDTDYDIIDDNDEDDDDDDDNDDKSTQDHIYIRP